tara:strand:+ start:677 stop:2116 length:1440 start_codon:yes stop_codon:yes gene_type:complete
MTIVSSGALALQDLGTNTSSTVDNVRLNTSFTAGVDGLLQIKRQTEVDDGVFVDSTVWQGDAYGYNLGMFSIYYLHNVFDLDVGPTFGNVKYASVSNIGALGTTGYLSADGTSRTIGGVFWGLPDASPNNVRLFIFALNGTGITNTDTAAWSKIEVTTNGGTTVTINRSDLSYDSSENGDSWWYFSGSSGTVYNAIGSLGTPSSSAYTIKVIGGTTSATANNGIAEEFGGDDSSNVKISDYYKNGGSAVPPFVSSSVSASIPTSGQIKFSDFYGATDVPAVTSAVTIQPAVKYDTNTGPRGGQYEFICHGLGQTYHNTYSSSMFGFNSSVNSTHLTDSNQGSLVGATYPVTNFGLSSTLGTLRAITHFTYGPSGSSHGIMMVVEGTGSDSNSGFTNLVATRSGMTTLTLPRSSATYTYVSSGTARIWRWNSSQVSAIANYRSGTPASQNVDSTLFPGGSGTNNSSSSTTTTSRTTWTIS